MSTKREPRSQACTELKMATKTEPTPQVYRKFAAIYDKMQADRHSVLMTEYCRRIFSRFKIRPRTGLDLCCGTGSAIREFTDLGIKMSGLDRSAEMLAVAAGKLKGRKVKLYQSALPHFRILSIHDSTRIERFELVTCFYDSLNYLKNASELKTAFQSVHDHLEEDGWFIFDMNTEAGLKTLWDEQVFADAHDDLAWVWKNEYNPKTKSAACHATFFLKKGRTWERFEETHVEHAFDNQTIKRLLKEAGFRIKGFYDCRTFVRASKRDYRICAVAKRI